MSSVRPKWDTLLEQGLLTEADLNRAAREAAAEQIDIEQVLNRQFRISKEALGAALAAFYHCPYVSFEPRVPAPKLLLKNLKAVYLGTNFWVPLWVKGGRITVLIDDPTHLLKRDGVQALLGTSQIDYAVGLKEDIRAYIDSFFGGRPTQTEAPQQKESQRMEDLDEIGEGRDQALSDLLHQMILDAEARGASDIHIEPHPDDRPIDIRLRIDGACVPFQTLPPRLRHLLPARVKAMADLDPGEKRLPQEGRLLLEHKEQRIELRVNTVPTLGGVEDVILHRVGTGRVLSLSDLDFSQRNKELVEKLLSRPYGLLLVTGAPGSGKTTTLHSALSALLQFGGREQKIWTIEEPIEISQEPIRQILVNTKVGLSCAVALRTCLRADANVIMVGDLRDTESSSLAVEAALGGKRVLVGLDAGSAVHGVQRLLDADRHGVDPYHLADALLGVVAQRLVRRLCSSCKVQVPLSDQERDELAFEFGQNAVADRTHLYKAPGCPECHHTGYRGRVVLHEVLATTEAMQALIRQRRSALLLREQATADGMVTLKMDGLAKVFAGLTDLRELRAVVGG